ncbi:hypothetical protein CYMTET_36856 [Cymbomonas tetramitiformis]|uniref:2-dehydropantoate 2-reductase n=1 Tax=Cymbomonas tetramitiformis TaxID=36881 RepID=A0AAE0CGD7_9CHLO|nr:hypothetical protein CYMTET_36856 [Cymbomonas tetramitiformis]
MGTERKPFAVVIGGGRVGTYLACKLTKVGGPVILKGRGASKPSKMKTQVELLCKEAGVVQTTSYESLYDTTVEYVFITTKTYDFDAVQKDLEAANVKAKVFVMIHNGIVKPMFENSVRVVVTQSWDFHETPGEGVGVKIVVRNEEKPWAMPNTPQAKEIEALLTKCGINASASKEFEFMLLKKYFINGVANLCAILGDCNCNGLLADHRDRMELLYAEIFSVLKNIHPEGFSMMPSDFHEAVFAGLATYGEHFPSTKMDFDAGLDLEIGSLNGYVLDMAKEQGIKVPATEELVALVRKKMVERDGKSKCPFSAFRGKIAQIKPMQMLIGIGALAVCAMAVGKSA